MVARSFVESVVLTSRLCDPLQDRPDVRLTLDQLGHEILLRAHLVGQGGKLLGQLQNVRVSRAPVLLAARKRALQFLQRIRGLLKKRLHIDRHRLITLADSAAAAQPRNARQPFF